MDGFFGSTEIFLRNAPFEVTLLRTFSREKRDMYLVRPQRTIEEYGTDVLLLLPKSPPADSWPTKNETPAFVFVFDGTPYVGKAALDEEVLVGKVKDWGVLTTTRDLALRWMVKPHEVFFPPSAPERKA